MTDISVMGERQVAGVGGTRPLRNVLGEALEGRASFEARKYLFSFQSYVHFEEFFVSRASVRFGAKRSTSRAFGFDDALELFLKTPLPHRAFFANSECDHEYFLKISFIFSKQSRCSLPDNYGDLQAEQSTFVNFNTSKTRMKTDFRALVRSSTEGSSIVVAIGTSRLR